MPLSWKAEARRFDPAPDHHHLATILTWNYAFYLLRDAASTTRFSPFVADGCRTLPQVDHTGADHQPETGWLARPAVAMIRA